MSEPTTAPAAPDAIKVFDPTRRRESVALATQVLQSVSDVIAGRPLTQASQPGSLVGPAPDAPMSPGQLIDQPINPTDPMAPPSPVTATPAPAQSSGRYSWGGFENGRIPDNALKKVGQGGHKLAAPAADSFIAMREAAAAAGVTLRLTDSYRSYDEQVATRKNKGHLVATATPGTSVHGWGKAVDVDVSDAKTLAWLQANGARFGWLNPEWAKAGGKNHEPWHWEYQGMAEGELPKRRVGLQ